MSGMVLNIAPPLGREPACPVLVAMYAHLSVLSSQVEWMCRSAEDVILKRLKESSTDLFILMYSMKTHPVLAPSEDLLARLRETNSTLVYHFSNQCSLIYDNFLYSFFIEQDYYTSTSYILILKEFVYSSQWHIW